MISGLSPEQCSQFAAYQKHRNGIHRHPAFYSAVPIEALRFPSGSLWLSVSLRSALLSNLFPRGHSRREWRNGLPFAFLAEMDILFAMTAADLTPDALAKLEAKLMADLEMVRKVRALLTEHQFDSAGPTTAPPAVPMAVPAPTTIFTPKPPERPREEVLKECLAATAGRPFAPQDFAQRIKEATKQWPGDKEVKTFLNRMIRQGSAVVHEVRRGRPGSLYRSLLPVPETSATSNVTETDVQAPRDGASS